MALLVAPAVAADRVALTNGDVLTGEVIAHDDTSITLKHTVLGEIVIDAKCVRSVAMDTPDSATAPAAPPPASQAKPLEPKAHQAPGTLQWLIEAWDHQLTLGLNGTSGNTDQQNYIARFNTRYQDGRDRWLFDTRWYLDVTDGDQTRNQFSADLTRDWLQEDSPWFFFLKGQYKYDTNRNWLNRTSGFGGGGYTLTKTDEIELNTRLGFGGSYEYGDINAFTPEALFGGSILKWNITERAAISGETIYYPSLEDSAEFRLETKIESTYKVDMAKGLSLRIGVENDYNSSMPNDSHNSDIKYYGAVVFKF